MALKGIKVIEFMGLAPGPLCGTILADFGASVTVVTKIDPTPFDVMSNGKRILSLNLKTKESIEIVKKLSSTSDVLLDTFRPGVMEKLGLGPKTLMEENKRLIYARLTGYGQNSIYKDMAGHDINYVAMSGILSLLKKDNNPPSTPINLLADFAGGSLLCAFGIVSALFERTQSGNGQVVDSSMTAGVAYLATWLFKSQNLPIWSGKPGTNALDGGLACYGTYETKDGKYMAVGALEPKFYFKFLEGLNLSEDEYNQMDTEKNAKKFKEVFLTKTQDEWCKIFGKLDACVTPVVDFNMVDKTEYNMKKEYYYRNDDGLIVPQPAPKLSRTPAVSVGSQSLPKLGQDTSQILKEIGYNKRQIEDLVNKGCIYVNTTSHL